MRKGYILDEVIGVFRVETISLSFPLLKVYEVKTLIILTTIIEKIKI